MLDFASLSKVNEKYRTCDTELLARLESSKVFGPYPREI